MACGGGLLDHGSILLSHLIHLIDRGIDLVERCGLLLRGRRDVVHDAIDLNARFTDEPRLEDLPWLRFRGRRIGNDGAPQDELERYGAEILVWRHLPLECVLEFACGGGAVAQDLAGWAEGLGRPVSAVHRPEWFF